MFKMSLKKWMLLMIILTKGKCNGCEKNYATWGNIGLSTPFDYNVTDVNVDSTVSLVSPTNVTLFEVIYIGGRIAAGPVYNNCTIALGNNVSLGILKIQSNPLQAGQHGSYQYRVNSVAKKCFYLFVISPPTQPTIGSNGTVAYEGKSEVLICSSTSTTFPSGHNQATIYEWRLDNVTVSTGGRFTVEPTTGKTLTISNINRNDELYSFSCKATEMGNTVLSTAYRLKVGYGPNSTTLTPSTTSYTLNENQLLNDITCSATCYPLCMYTWTKSGVGTINTTNGVLSLGNVHGSEAGTYWCTASNEAGSGKSSVNINLNYGPDSMTLTPSNTSYNLNENQHMNNIFCSASCYPPCTYTWIKAEAGTVSNNGVLSLETVIRSEAGNYWCTTADASRSVNSQKVTVQVFYGPDTVLLSPFTTSYSLNEHVHINNITCSASCFPACTYTWTKSGAELAGNTHGVLSLATLERQDTGNYMCTAKNSKSAATADSQSVVVKVRYGPDLVTMTPSSTNYTMIEGDSMNNITCSATCYPEQCTFRWTKSDVESSISNTDVLSLGSLQRGEAGIYTCTSRNPGSNATASSQSIQVLVRYCTTIETQQSLSQVGTIVGGVVPGILLVGVIAVLIYLRLSNRIHFTKKGVYEGFSSASTNKTAATDNSANAASNNYETLNPTSPDKRFAQIRTLGANDIELQEESAYQNLRQT